MNPELQSNTPSKQWLRRLVPWKCTCKENVVFQKWRFSCVRFEDLITVPHFSGCDAEIYLPLISYWLLVLFFNTAGEDSMLLRNVGDLQLAWIDHDNRSNIFLRNISEIPNYTLLLLLVDHLLDFLWTLKMDRVCSFETSLSFYRTTCHHIPEKCTCISNLYYVMHSQNEPLGNKTLLWRVYPLLGNGSVNTFLLYTSTR
jgi:hypothetical protein